MYNNNPLQQSKESTLLSLRNTNEFSGDLCSVKLLRCSWFIANIFHPKTLLYIYVHLHFGDRYKCENKGFLSGSVKLPFYLKRYREQQKFWYINKNIWSKKLRTKPRMIRMYHNPARNSMICSDFSPEQTYTKLFSNPLPVGRLSKYEWIKNPFKLSCVRNSNLNTDLCPFMLPHWSFLITVHYVFMSYIRENTNKKSGSRFNPKRSIWIEMRKNINSEMEWHVLKRKATQSWIHWSENEWKLS